MRILINTIYGTILFCLGSILIPVAANEEVNDPYALVISGGVSLGVYEAGLNWVIVETLKSENEKSNGEKYQLDTVTGTSAGAINSILSALRFCEVSKRADHLNNLFYKTWNIGITNLLPAEQSQYDKLELNIVGDEKEVLKDSLFARIAFKNTIDSIKNQSNLAIYKDDCKVKIAVVVTSSQSPQDAGKIAVQRYVVPIQLVTEKLPNEKHSRIRFVNYYDFAEVSGQNNRYIFLPEKDGEIDVDLVIRAALASSAFPLAFGRVKLKHCVQWDYGKIESQSFECPAGHKLSSGYFVDGGVFDNIPLRSAVDLVEGKSDFGARSKYIYIDPDKFIDESRVASDKIVDGHTENNDRIFLESSYTNQVHYTSGETVNFYAKLLPNITSSDYEVSISVVHESGLPVTVRQTKEYDSRIQLNSGNNLNFFRQFEIGQNALVGRYSFQIEIFRQLENEKNVLWKLENIAEFSVLDSGAMALRNQFNSLLPAITTLRRQELNWTMEERFGPENLDKRDLLQSVRSKPLTGYFLANFGAFLDPTFRAYDYAVGIFDGLLNVTRYLCTRGLAGSKSDAKGCSSEEEAELLKKLTVKLLNLESRDNECANTNSSDEYIPNICLTIKAFTDSYANSKYKFDWNLELNENENQYPSATYLINEILEENPVIDFEGFLTEMRAKIFAYSIISNTPPRNQFASVLTDIMNRESPDWKNNILLKVASRFHDLEKQSLGEAERPLAALWVMTPETNVGGKLIKNYSPYRPKYPWWYKAFPYFVGVDGAQTGSVLTWSTKRHPVGFITDNRGINTNLFTTFNFQFSEQDRSRKGSTSLGLTVNYEFTDSFLFSSIGTNLFASYDKYGYSTDWDEIHPGLEIYWGFMGDKFRISLGNRNLENPRGNWLLKVGISEFHRFIPLIRSKLAVF